MKIILDEARIVIERVEDDIFKISSPDIPTLFKNQIHTVNVHDTLTILLSNVIVETAEDKGGNECRQSNFR